MTPQAAPTSSLVTNNTNAPFGGAPTTATDYSKSQNILNYLPSQIAATNAAGNQASTNTGSILPNISINAPTYTAPTAQSINAGSYGTNLTGYNAAVQNAENSLTSQENTTYGNAMNTLNSAEQQYGNLTPVYQGLANDFGITGYQNDITNLNSLLASLNSDVHNDTSYLGGALNSSAANEKYQEEYQPLETNLNAASQALNYGQNDISNLLDTYEKSLTNELTPLQQNISNLPTLFDQTNSAAETGYNQGQQSIEDTISNRIQQQQANAASSQAASYAKMVASEYGGLGTTNGTVAALSSNTIKGISLKNSKAGGSSGYDFTIGNTPVSANTFAASNGLSLSGILSYMAENGDSTAGNALGAIMNNGGKVDNNIINQYSSLFWDGSNSGSSSPSSSKPKSSNSGQINTQYGNSTIGNNGSEFSLGSNPAASLSALSGMYSY